MKIDIIYNVAAESGSEERGLFEKASISVEEFGLQIRGLAEGVSTALEDIASELRAYQLDEVKLRAEISSEGKLALLGSGVSSALTCGVELSFKKVGVR